MAKKILIGLIVILVIIQFFRPTKNISDAMSAGEISYQYVIPDSVDLILKAACHDCHSNNSTYPWYSNIQPVAWWMNNHIVDGKRHVNFTTFTSAPIAVQNHKFEEIAEMVKEKEMPLPSYTWLGMHPKANLTDAQRELLADWAEAQMDTLKANYPADSLIMKRRAGGQSSGAGM